MNSNEDPKSMKNIIRQMDFDMPMADKMNLAAFIQKRGKIDWKPDIDKMIANMTKNIEKKQPKKTQDSRL